MPSLSVLSPPYCGGWRTDDLGLRLPDRTEHMSHMLGVVSDDFDINEIYGDLLAASEQLLKSGRLTEDQKRGVRLRVKILEEARKRANRGDDPLELAKWLNATIDTVFGEKEPPPEDEGSLGSG